MKDYYKLSLDLLRDIKALRPHSSLVEHLETIQARTNPRAQMTDRTLFLSLEEYYLSLEEHTPHPEEDIEDIISDALRQDDLSSYMEDLLNDEDDG